ncbi:PfaB family protein [Psychromonas hadalis]|uniref:PfaB family protein n=1 Tax=Psychromonas hadalis TaxID=211669 RepID=UPI0003B6A5EC|nr:PfaB family protein [Psychromonas hadalis]
MVKQVINQPLDVIGFNAIFNDLDNIDQVESALYRGEVLTASSALTHSYAELCKKCVNLVVEANNLTAKQIAVLIVGDNASAIEGAHFSVETVNSISDAFNRAEQITKQSDIAVLIISASLPESIVNSEKSTISFDAGFESYAQLQGVACLLVASKVFVHANNSVCYATIDNMVTGSDAQAVIAHSLQHAGLRASEITTLEVSACADAVLNQQEQQALLNAYTNDKTLTTAISCHKSVLGENGRLSELMAIIHSVIALQQRYRPAIKDWCSPTENLLSDWRASPFYLFNQAAPVFPSLEGKPRVNSVSLLNQQGYSHLIIRASEDGLIHQNGFNAHSKQSLFIIGADDEPALLQKLAQLTVDGEIKTLAKQLYLQHKNSDFSYKVVLIAESADELKREIKLALNGIKIAFEKQGDWKTPKGSFFSSCTNKQGKTAFLYPGIGATYVGLGRELFHLFPEIYPSVVALADNIGASLKDSLLNPRSVVSFDFKQLKQLDHELRNSLANIAECGVGYACVFTKIFEQVFNIKADFASGYSMGEISMFAALGCWQTPGLMSARLAGSDTFNHQLSSELRAIRKLWNLPDIKDGECEQIWETYSIKGSADKVNAQIKSDERVYVTIINTPDSLTIGGFPADCLQVIKRLSVRAMPLNMANAIHSAPAYQEYDKMVELYSMAVTERIQTKMISSSCYLPIPQHQKAIAVSIAKCLCEPVDFPRLVNTLACKGSTVFIEMGAGRSLCSWTDKILKESKAEHHISVPVNAKGTDDQLTYARAVAKLVSVGVDINIDSFFSGSMIKQVNK